MLLIIHCHLQSCSSESDIVKLQNFRKIKKFGPWPERRSSHAACVLNYDQEFPQLLVAGGLDNNKDPIGDLWLFSVDHGMWMKVYNIIFFLTLW